MRNSRGAVRVGMSLPPPADVTRSGRGQAAVKPRSGRRQAAVRPAPRAGIIGSPGACRWSCNRKAREWPAACQEVTCHIRTPFERRSDAQCKPLRSPSPRLAVRRTPDGSPAEGGCGGLHSALCAARHRARPSALDPPNGLFADYSPTGCAPPQRLCIERGIEGPARRVIARRLVCGPPGGKRIEADPARSARPGAVSAGRRRSATSATEDDGGDAGRGNHGATSDQ